MKKILILFTIILSFNVYPENAFSIGTDNVARNSARKEMNWNVPQTYLYYADWLADSGDYYRAIGEYKKVLYFFPEYKKKPWIYFQIGRMYYLGGHYSLAIQFLTPLTNEKNEETLQMYARNWLGLSHYENQNYTVSYQIFYDLQKKSTNEEDALDYKVYAGLSLMQQKKFDYALKEFSEIKKGIPQSDYKNDPAYNAFIHKTIHDLKEINNESPPSAVYAGIFGIFPGGGYMYLRQWDYAFVSLSLIALSSYLAYDGWVDSNMVQATIFSTLGISFYIGSIYSGYREATRVRAEWGNEINAKAEHRIRELSFRIRHRY